MDRMVFYSYPRLRWSCPSTHCVSSTPIQSLNIAAIEVWATLFWHGVIHRLVVTPVQWGHPCWAMYWSLHCNPWDLWSTCEEWASRINNAMPSNVHYVHGFRINQWLSNCTIMYAICMTVHSMSYNAVRRAICAHSCCFPPATWQIIQALHSLDMLLLTTGWDLKRNPAGCMPKDLECPISDPAVFLTLCWPNIINLPLTFPFAMWHER